MQETVVEPIICELEHPSGMECPFDAEIDYSELEKRVQHFLDNSEDSAVTGIRRMGREEFVRFVVSVGTRSGHDITIYPDASGKMVMFYHWDGIQYESQSILKNNPKADMMYGQDLCHQVPAVVRFKKQ